MLDSSTSLSSIEECGRSLPARGSTSGIGFKRTAPASGESLRFFIAVAGLGVWRDPSRPRSLSRRGRRCRQLRGPRLRGRMGGRDGDPRDGGLRPGVAACSLPGGWGFTVRGPRCGVDGPVCEVAQADPSELAQGKRMARGLLGSRVCSSLCTLGLSPAAFWVSGALAQFQPTGANARAFALVPLLRPQPSIRFPFREASL